jgi:hypothetical protein
MLVRLRLPRAGAERNSAIRESGAPNQGSWSWPEMRGDVLPVFERRFVACAVPDVQNLNALRFLADVLENAIRTNHDFAQRPSRAPGISWSNVWEVCQNSNVGEYPTPDSGRRLRVMLGGMGPDVLKVRDGGVRPNYLEVHAVAQDSSRRSASS